MKDFRRIILIILLNLRHLLRYHPHVLLISLDSKWIRGFAFQVKCFARDVIQTLLTAWILNERASHFVTLIASQNIELLH